MSLTSYLIVIVIFLIILTFLVFRGIGIMISALQEISQRLLDIINLMRNIRKDLNDK